MAQTPEIAIVGRACRFPGANSVSKLWSLLVEQRCAITRIPPDRWSLERFSHPRQGERGRSYTWAAGVLDDVWGFDPGAFGMSPREAEQIDPQQRLLLELTWEALEDAGIRPSSIAGTETGVFVGASTNDYGNSKLFDHAAADGYFATGNAASIMANRISYIFDLNGPSFTVDTACSSSLVALDAAMQALHSGRIDTAIVGGVSILLTPFQFMSFAQATMLSRTGLCQAFSAKADGYVRSEGGAVLVLRRANGLETGKDRAHAHIVTSRINSDGRTNGIALPSKKRQAQLLEQIYGRDIDVDRLAFVEAHGTGTPVGDPVEASALGEAIGRRRRDVLPIGSIKSNIGHTEAAAGMGGMLKAMLALEHDLLPPSLHCDELNPNIDFERLNLSVARRPLPLARTPSPRLAGISSYGFGGTNSHVVLSDPSRPGESGIVQPAQVLMLSAHTRSALHTLATDYAARLDVPAASTGRIAAALGHRRDRLPERLVVPLAEVENPATALRDFVAKGADAGPAVAVGTALSRQAKVAFVYSGNGSQWVGMGRSAYRGHAGFRAAFDAIDGLFQSLSGWSLTATLNADTLADQLGKTSVAQPLIFAIQAATTRVMKSLGLHPHVVLGHSVGEVAAAEAAGALDLATAVKVIYYRSLHQELVFDTGSMAVLIGSRDAADTLLAQVPGLSIAAYNSPRAITFSGTVEALDGLAKAARAMRARVQKLDLAYPFHSDLIAAIEAPLMDDLGTIVGRETVIPFVSTVTGTPLAGSVLDSRYWWRNVREPVLFEQAIEQVAALEARVFVEIGPSPILLSHVTDVLSSRGDQEFATLPVFERRDHAADPFTRTLAAALARGAAVDEAAVFGSDPGSGVELGTYPWQRKPFHLDETPESLHLLTPRPWHPLIGARASLDVLEWHNTMDTTLLPAMADHVVDGHVLLPGSAFAEMALAAARDWLGTETAFVVDFEIHSPMILDGATSREARVRIQPVTGMLEIMSRPRLSQAGWQTHVTAKVARYVGEAEPLGSVPRPDAAPDMRADDLYPFAAQSGLHYGPGFRLLEGAFRLGRQRILVELAPEVAGERGAYGFDPARVDACFHGLALLYSELAAGGHFKPYVPVAIAELKLFQPGASVCRALIEILRADERTILADIHYCDGADGVIASMRRVRFQAMSAFRSSEETIEFVGTRTILAAEPLATHGGAGPSVADLIAAAHATGRVAEVEGQPAPDYVLLEGWATSAAFGLIAALSDGGHVSPAALADSGRVPQHLLPWIRQIAATLTQSGLLTPTDDDGFRLAPQVELPPPEVVLQALAMEHPERSAELLLAARAGAVATALAEGHVSDTRLYTTPALDAFDYGGSGQTEAADLVLAVLRQVQSRWPSDRALRVLQVGDGPLSMAAGLLAAEQDAELTVLEPNRRRLERVKLALEGIGRTTILGDVGELADGAFDLVIASSTLFRWIGDGKVRTALSRAMASEALLVSVDPESSMYRDMVFGLLDHWDPAGAEHAPTTIATETAWRHVLADMDLTEVTVLHAAGAEAALMSLGQKIAERGTRPGKGDAVVIGGDGAAKEVAAAVTTMLMFSGLKVASAADDEDDFQLPESADTILYVAYDAAGPRRAAGRIAERCLRLQRLADRIGSRTVTLWIVCPGATRSDIESADPVASAVWSFARSLANEVQTLDVRLIDLAPDLPADVAARRLREIVLSGTSEMEIVADAQRTALVRFERIATAPREGTDADGDRLLHLVKGEQSGLDRLRWSAAPRRMPGAREVEIAIEVSGLNFRDVMWGLSILPDEILEDGYAGPTLGLECAGTVTRVGAEVHRLKVGDRVLAFAKAALATHATVDVDVVAAIPAGLSPEAAATIPVAFLTAYWGLIQCARLERGESVLIHGGAGGVGLAALQIARWRGAMIFATAGSEERRDLLVALGADHVFDSRSNQFVDDIRAVSRSGVDVVLNSLSGEAMERSIAVLNPFGRFVELGKRDYVSNTHIGLKPFRRNLSYFGVDLDQLLLKGGHAGRDLFDAVMALFADGTFAPLPYRVFPARETVDAFRVMQRSGHVGKIVIRPPAEVGALPDALAPPFRADRTRSHLVTGGLSGFGLATARWLVERGARHLVLVGRSGAASPEAREAIEDLRARGADVTVAALDITDEPKMASLVEGLRPPLGGVVHAAALYDDGLIANITREKLDRVLGAKVTGAEVLDRVTRSAPLDYFILYSSATTVIGNPGQGAYVAANAFLEGLARRRRAEGLPAFAAAWGAIRDVGILARSGSVATSLLARTGVAGMAAKDALDRLGEVVGDNRHSGGLAIAAVNWSAARDTLRILRTSTFEKLMVGVQDAGPSQKGKIVVRDLVEQEGVEAATRLIAETVQEEIARILRLPRDDISRNKPLMEIGLDSLMAVELGMGLEQRFVLDAPLATSTGAMSVNELADYVVGLAGGHGGLRDQASESLAYRHLDADLRREVVDALPDLRANDTAPRKETIS